METKYYLYFKKLTYFVCKNALLITFTNLISNILFKQLKATFSFV